MTQTSSLFCYISYSIKLENKKPVQDEIYEAPRVISLTLHQTYRPILTRFIRFQFNNPTYIVFTMCLVIPKIHISGYYTQSLSH